MQDSGFQTSAAHAAQNQLLGNPDAAGQQARLMEQFIRSMAQQQ